MSDSDDGGDDGSSAAEGSASEGDRKPTTTTGKKGGKGKAGTSAPAAPTSTAIVASKGAVAGELRLPKGAFRATLSTVIGPLSASIIAACSNVGAVGGAGAASSSGSLVIASSNGIKSSVQPLTPAEVLASAVLRKAAGQIADLMRVLPGLALRKRVGSVTGVAGGFSLLAEPAYPEVLLSFTPATTTARRLGGAQTLDPGSVQGVATLRLLYACRAVKTATLDAELAALDAAGAAASEAAVSEKAKLGEDGRATKRKRPASPKRAKPTIKQLVKRSSAK